jgi:hypothetical protein
VLSFCAAMMFGTCKDADGAEVMARQYGFTEVSGGSWLFWGCTNQDWWRTELFATSPTGKRVRLAVCESLTVPATVRVLDVIE